MLRRSWLSLCAAGAGRQSTSSRRQDEHDDAGEEDEDEPRARFVEPGGFGMKLEDAYRMFGYKLSDKVEKASVKERFKQLAKKVHPDAGGSEKAFLQLMEAQKLLMNHSHEPKSMPGTRKARSVNFVRQDHSDIFNSVTWENADDLRKIIPVDWFIGIMLFFFFTYAYVSWMVTNVTRSSDGRSRMNEDDMREQDESKMTKASHAWHPWKASSELRDQVRDVESERRTRLDMNPKPMPWAQA
jgi:hypothetical protein